MIKKFLLQGISVAIMLLTLIYFTDTFLVHDNIFHCSISSIIHQAHHLTIVQHLLILGLLPIYIATIVYGACLLGAYLGTKVGYLLKTK
ncbi:MAG TPA: hypothetical protein VJN02_01250 [Gammaproteobacteria bacterium]|nr:hypothetical protein [Gammaproteobacteria bacterium]